MSDVVEHTWVPIEHPPRTSPASPAYYTVVVIGATGVGKSSLIKLFCGSSVRTSAGTQSCTTGATVFPEVNGGSRQWLDTQGTDDSEMKENDVSILKQSFKALYEQNVRSCKIIWCISGDLDRARGGLGQQARYISGLGLDNSNIWNSCLIISKCGALVPHFEDIAGVIAASKAVGHIGEWTKKNIMGYTCVDDSWGLRGTKKDMYDILQKLPPEFKTKSLYGAGYLSSTEVKELVIKKLDSLSPFSLTFLHEKCSKCGAEGDHRYLNKKCHATKITVHTQLSYFFHPGYLQSYHPGSSKNRREEDGFEWYHPGRYKKDTSVGRTIGGIFSLGITEIAGGWKYWTCCDCGNRNSSGCTRKYNFKNVRGWECCVYGLQHSGCKSKYSCCGSKNGNGCRQRYHCCNKDVPAPPCTDICSLCRKPWGTGPGCSIETM